MRDARPLPSASMPALEAGATLGRYQLICVVAQGGMGAVWAATLLGDHGFERTVAVKTILPQLAQERRFRDMFLDEARLASRITHANVVQVLDLAEQDGVLFQAMEWVDGDSLRVLATTMQQKSEAIPWPLAIRIVLEIAKGLHAAHELRDEQGALLHVVHRDVSPQNVLLGLDGSVRLSDFGIAKARDRLSPETSQGSIKGKLRYMAPEQALGKPIDRRADIWSLAAILYEMLSGRPLFDAPHEAALLYELVSTPPTLLFEEPIHPRLLAVLRRALSRSPEARHPTAEAFADDLRRAAREAGLEATTEDLAAFFKDHLGDRCDARRLHIKQSIAASVANVPARIDSAARLRASGVERDRDPRDDETSLDRSLVQDTPSASVLLEDQRRRRAVIAGALLLGGIALAAAWYVAAPRELLMVRRGVVLETASSPIATAATAAEAASDSAPGAVPVPRASASVSSANRPPPRTPPPETPPRFEDIDDGF